MADPGLDPSTLYRWYLCCVQQCAEVKSLVWTGVPVEPGNPEHGAEGSDKDHWLLPSSILESLRRSNILLASVPLALGSRYAETSALKFSEDTFLLEKILLISSDKVLVCLLSLIEPKFSPRKKHCIGLKPLLSRGPSLGIAFWWPDQTSGCWLW